MRPRVVVIDYGVGNVHSAVKALEAAGAEVTLTANKAEMYEADGVLLPGVGSFAHVAEQARSHRLGEVIGRRLAGGRPVLGICVGMQILFDEGEEGGTVTEGLGEWPGRVRKLDAEPLPHMGWNTVEPDDGSTLFAGLSGERFYFVHSYAAHEIDLSPHPKARPIVRTWSSYGERFLAAVENGPLSATQFHPEKSGEAGIQLLRNWINSL
ncbi:imidazole glycerol phosphate synthase subunit HisH [Pseudoclavibacter albus]|uniref:imidazole glycerol phosphate synthase subunit HisH n=1 Tax=Pseudoclavibacter albus TaxID=272241 RepID=UPI000826449F|nr:imidazole glycerol phosphate synthase subunit HisH [Pseudoclavibacter alba]